MFAHSYVTGPPGAANSVSLSEAEFDLRKRRGLFVMDWEAAGLRYAIGTEINYWLALGLSVVVCGAHEHLEQALRTYPDLTVIWIANKPGSRPAGEELVSMLAGQR